MNAAEAMTRAVEFAVSHGLEKRPYGEKIVALLQKSASLMAVREEKRNALKSWCWCGEKMGPVRLVCAECHAVIPAKMLLTFWLGTKSESSRAKADIVTLCEARGAKAARQRFAPERRVKPRGGQRPSLRGGLQKLTEGRCSERGLT